MEETKHNKNVELIFNNIANEYTVKVGKINVYDMGAYFSEIRKVLLKIGEKPELYDKTIIDLTKCEYVDNSGERIDIKNVHPSIIFDTLLLYSHFGIKNDYKLKFKLSEEWREYLKNDIKKGNSREIRLPLSKLEHILKTSEQNV